jgi:hypothetical protein
MTDNRINQLNNIQYEAKNLFEKKNKDYGDAFAEYGPVGVLVRIGDKIKRLQNISKNGITLIEDEKMRDTLIDLHNYAAMSIMLLDETSDNYDTDEVILEDNIEQVETWNILNECEFKGDSGNIYTCKEFINNETKETYKTCTCPSFIYSSNLPKTCKHIINEDNMFY